MIGRCFGVRYFSFLGVWGFSLVGKSSGCTRLRLWYELVSNLDFVGMPEDDSKESKHVAKIIIYVILKLTKYIILLCRRKYIVDLQ